MVVANQNIHRHSQSSEQQISISVRAKLLLLFLLLLNLTLTKSTVANDNIDNNSNQISNHNNNNGNRKQRRRLTTEPSGGRQSDTSVTDDCVLNSYGIYGTIDTSNTATINEIYNIEYLYQVSVTIGTTNSQLSTDIILPIDSVITTTIIPSFFPSCNSINRFLQATNNSSSSSSSGAIITAISSTPVDTYVPSGRRSYMNCSICLCILYI